MSRKAGLISLSLLLAAWCGSQGAGVPATNAPAAPVKDPVKDPFAAVYAGYEPDFVGQIRQQTRRDPMGCFVPGKNDMERSVEKSFYSVSRIAESERATALVKAAMGKEEEGRYREALEIYQKVIDEYPDSLHRVSGHGVFVPVAQYCQLRILGFPKEHLDFYRVKHDSRAQEAFEMARRSHSLEGLAEIRDGMLSTSYGGRALLTLGLSALDRGSHLEALEYLDKAWEFFPDQRAGAPELAAARALCRKMLGTRLESDPGYGMIGHWKLDETTGDRAADSTGRGNEGAIARSPNWAKGRIGGAHRFDWTNAIAIPERGALDIGVAGEDFSVAFWVWLDDPRRQDLFAKRTQAGDEVLRLSVVGKGQIAYELTTGDIRPEDGASKGGVGSKRWSHVAFVREGSEIRLFIDGRLDVREKLRRLPLKNSGAVTIGGQLRGFMDDVRLYGRALLDRETAELAMTPGLAALKVSVAHGEAPLTVDLEYTGPEVGAGARFFWEFGDGDTATGPRVRHTFGFRGDYRPVLTVTDSTGGVSVARGTVDVAWPARDAALGVKMDALLSAATQSRPARPEQAASAPHVSASDYRGFVPTPDPLGIRPPVWDAALPQSREEIPVYTDPVLTAHSVIYRHKNIVYCRSALNGSLRWKNELGGLVSWQDENELQYPREDILVQDGVVYTPLYKGGATLVALDEITGQVKWAYGPMTPATDEEAKMRFLAAPAGGPRSVFAGYVQDNIEGETHVDTEFGVMAFEAGTGRVKWRTPMCRLQPGKFAGGFAMQRRNLIRSFTSPPLYHDGTVYHGSNAGTVAALDALSGRVKWLIRYPSDAFPDGIHDATRKRLPVYWQNQRPLLLEDNLLVLPVDSPLMFSVDRRSGKVVWSRLRIRNTPAWVGRWFAYFLGPTRNGELALAWSGRGYVELLDPRTGRTVWDSGDVIAPAAHPVLANRIWGAGHLGVNLDRFWYLTAAPPFLDADDRLVVTGYQATGWPIWSWVSQLAVVDLRRREVVDRREYLEAGLLRSSGEAIRNAPTRIKEIEEMAHKNEGIKAELEMAREVAADTVPQNTHGPFVPFSRVTRELYGTVFEFRISARSVGMVYDRAAVQKALAGREDTGSLLARAELAFGESRFEEAAARLKQSLEQIPSEAWDVRAMVNQQLHQVYRQLARDAVRSRNRAAELAACVGMSRTVNSREEEMETLLALSEAQERQGDVWTAARLAQELAGTYGQDECPIPSMIPSAASVKAAGEGLLDGAVAAVGPSHHYQPELAAGLTLARGGLGLYFSALTPVPKDLRLRAGEVAARRLLGLRQAHAAVGKELEQSAERTLGACSADEALLRLWEFPGTRAAQAVLDRLGADSDIQHGKGGGRLDEAARRRKTEWALADLARICSLRLPEGVRERTRAPTAGPPPAGVGAAFGERTDNLDEDGSPAWLLLDRKGESAVEPNRIFLGARVRRRLDNKFLLSCRDVTTGKPVWRAQEPRGGQWFNDIRLQGQGEEPGFFTAFVFRDVVVVHGLYDVLAFGLKDGKLRWRYLAPFSFEIRHAEMSGDLLVIGGASATVALYLGTADPRGEVAWETQEEGSPYAAPYFLEDRLVSVRRMPFNVTVRHRATGRMMGRLALPDLLMQDEHPLLESGPRALPLAHDGVRLALTDGWYYLMVDVEQMRVIWKRIIDANDRTRLPPMRMALKGEYLAVLKQDFDVKALHMLSAGTGALLWKTDPKDPHSRQPLDSMIIGDGKIYGLIPHAGQGFYFAGLDCQTGKALFAPNEQTGYEGKPEVRLRPELYGRAAVAELKDRQNFEIKVFDLASGKLTFSLKTEGAGDLGVHGCASATVQNGSLALLGKTELKTAVKK